MISTYLSILKSDYKKFEISARMAGATLSDKKSDPKDKTRYRVLVAADSARNFFFLGKQFRHLT